MASVLIAKPRTTSGFRLTGTAVGATSSESPFFYIKMRSIDMKFETNLVKVTGAADTNTCWDNDEQIRSRFVIRGWMVNGQALGLSALRKYDETSTSIGRGQGLTTNQVNGPVGVGSMTVSLSNSRTIQFNYVRIERVDIDMDTQAPFVEVVITGYGHETGRTAYESGIG